MRSLLVLLLLLAPGVADERAALSVLAGLLDDADTRVAAAERIDALGFGGIPLLDRLLGSVRSDEGQAKVVSMLAARGREIRRRVLSGEREWFGKDVKPHLAKASAEALGVLRAALGPADEPVLFFDATTFKDPKRLLVLEYLVCPVRDGDAGKSYECLAGMDDAEWAEFGRAFAGGRALRLRWVVFGWVSTEVAVALPWAGPVLGPEGLKLGGNHDESGNGKLPDHGLPIQVGVVMR